MNTTKTKVRSTEEALKLAFDLANMHHTDYGYFELRSKVRQFAKKVLTQPKDPEQRSVSEHLEPVAWPTMPPSKGQSPVLFEDGYAEGWAKCMSMCKAAFANITPPQRTWVGLTDIEWMNIVNKDQAWFGQRPDEVAHEVAKLVEAKLKEKNT
jgi:hypothetical protein